MNGKAQPVTSSSEDNAGMSKDARRDPPPYEQHDVLTPAIIALLLPVQIESTDESGHKMEWNRNNSNGAVAPPHSQQYLLSSNSSMVANGQNQLSSPQQNSIAQNEYFNSNKDHVLLHNLLKAKNNEDILKVQQVALSNIGKSNSSSNWMKSGHRGSTYKPAGGNQEAVSIPDNRSTVAVQNTVGSNHRGSNRVHQTPQQPPSSSAVRQQFGNGYNAVAIQQPLQSSQALQNYQPTVTYTFPQQDMYASRRLSTIIQIPCQQMAPNVVPSTRYILQNNVSGQFTSSQKMPAETNVSASMQDCRNSQNVTCPSLPNYRYAPHQQMSVPQTLPQTLPQLDGNANCYTQNQQIQNMQNVLVNTTVQTSSAAAAAKMLPTYTQATMNPPNVLNPSGNQNFCQQRQNYVGDSVQQPLQTGNPVPGLSSSAEEQFQFSDRRREMFKLLLVYRNVKRKYELLNQENNLLRQKLQANASTEKTGPPPLLSNMTAQPQTNCLMTGQQNVTQNVPAQNSAQTTSTRAFQDPNVYDSSVNAQNQVGMQHNLSLQENAILLNQILKPNDGNRLGQNNYSVFDGGQANGLASALHSLENLTSKVGQEATTIEFRGQSNSNDQTVSSPTSSNGNTLQNGLGLYHLDKQISVTESLNSACPEKKGFERLPSCANGLTGNEVTPISREAIEASLPLWKTVPQTSSHNTNKSSETQHNRAVANSSLAAFTLLDAMTMGPTNELSSTIPAQKQDLAIPNPVNPQIAIVPPLVQSKDALQDDYQMSKVRIHGADAENHTISGLIKSHENDCFNKILHALECLGANTVSNNIETSRSKEPPVESQATVGSPLPSSTEDLSQDPSKACEDVEMSNSFQISGICTLVEGSSFYDSSIAMIFDDSSNTTALSHTDSNDDHSITEDPSCILKASCSTSSEDTTVAIKSEAVDKVEAEGSQTIIKEELRCNVISGTDMETDQHMFAQQKSYCDLESGAMSDQLTDLLTEFPYGIKNYMAEHQSTNGPSGKADKPVPKLSVPKDYEPVNEGKAIGDIKSEMVLSPSVDLPHVVEMDLDKSDSGLPAEKVSEKQLKPAKDVDEASVTAIDSCSDDGYEIISNSPVSDIHITLLDQDEIPKIFPDEDDAGSEKNIEIKAEGLQNCANTREPKTESPLLKTDSDVTDAGTDKNLFCCLFSWLTHTNGNAPKCNCQQLELSKVESDKLFNNSLSIIKTDKYPQSPEETFQGLPKPKDGGLEISEPTMPPKLDLVDSDCEDILQPVDKPPKLERIVSEAKNVHKSTPDLTPLPESGLKRSTSVESCQSSKDILRKNKHVKHQKTLTPNPGHVEPTFNKTKEHSPHRQLKSHGSHKSERLIVKTDFLKSKHPYKTKRKREEKNATVVDLWTPNKRGSRSGVSKNLPGESRKKPQVEEKSEQTTSAVKVEQSSDQQAGGCWNRQTYTGVDRSSHSGRGRRHKEKESHFEKTRKVPTVQEYLERKRELCRKRSESSSEPREGVGDKADKPIERSGNPPANVKRPLSPAKTNVNPKENKRHSETLKGFYRNDRSQSEGQHETGHRKRRSSQNGQRGPEKKGPILQRFLNKDKIYLSPCIGSRRTSCEGINLAKLQIRHSPEKPKLVERRRSLESSVVDSKPSKSDVKSYGSPKMLEFKLCPEFVHGSPPIQEKVKEATDPKAKSVVEGIKSSKEAWVNNIPLKKRKVVGEETQGSHKSPTSAGSTSNVKPSEKNAVRPAQDSQTTFNVFKQMYHEQRSKSVDGSQGNS